MAQPFSMNRPPYIPPSTLATVAQAIAITLQQSYGVDSQEVFSSVGIDPAVTRDSSLRLPVATLSPLWRRCVEITGDEGFGLRVARYLQPASLYGVDLALFVCATLGDAVTRFVQLLNVLSSVTRPELIEDQAGDWRLEFHLLADIQPEAAAVDCFLYFQVRLFERLSGKRSETFLRQVELRKSAPQNSALWQIFGSPVLFTQPITALVFRRESFALPLPGANPGLQAQIEQPILQYLIQNNMPIPLGAMQAQLAGMLADNPTPERLATALGLTNQHLRETLRKQKLTFTALLDQTRETQVLALLGIPELSLEEIAQRTGYSKSGHLIRAFRRWRGTTPQKHRQQSTPAVK